jgi:hypothetical protein
MKKTIRPAGFFAKAQGTLSWKDRLAKMRGKKKPQATAKLEIDDANGEKLTFPEIGDVSEIAEGVAVTATDGEHVFTSDSATYTVTVLAGVITAVVETPIEEEPAPESMSAETVEFIEAVAEAMEVSETFQATAKGQIEKLTSDLETALGEIKTLKASMSHGRAKEGEGDDDDEPKPLMVNGKPINLKKINLK